MTNYSPAQKNVAPSASDRTRLAGSNPLLQQPEIGTPSSSTGSKAQAVGVKRIRALRTKLYGLGLEYGALSELRTWANAPNPGLRAEAARELALWYLHKGRTFVDFETALDALSIARAALSDTGPNTGLDTEIYTDLTTIEQLALYRLGDPKKAAAQYRRAVEAGEISRDTVLARANFQPIVELRLATINGLLRSYGIAPLSLLPDLELSPYDRLTAKETRDLTPCLSGPRVTVLVAVYNGVQTLRTALSSLLAQTWRNLEILVIDDCSTDGTCDLVAETAARDSRVKLLKMQQNGGAYQARNLGLDHATGEFVTIHDADDWSHPTKIESQVRFLIETPEVLGCTSEQARASDDLRFPKLRGSGRFIVFNTSSFMFRKDPVQPALGYWDTVRFGADNEFIRRMQAVFGQKTFRKLSTGPLSFQRISESSVTQSSITGLSRFGYYGVRREYYDAQRYHHSSGTALRYSGNPSKRPFPVPRMMEVPKAVLASEVRVLDLVISGDLSAPEGPVAKLLEELPALKFRYGRIGLVEHFREDSLPGTGTGICAPLRAHVDGEAVSVLVYGDRVYARAERRLEGGLQASTLLPTVLPQNTVFEQVEGSNLIVGPEGAPDNGSAVFCLVPLGISVQGMLPGTRDLETDLKAFEEILLPSLDQQSEKGFALAIFTPQNLPTDAAARLERIAGDRLGVHLVPLFPDTPLAAAWPRLRDLVCPEVAPTAVVTIAADPRTALARHTVAHLSRAGRALPLGSRITLTPDPGLTEAAAVRAPRGGVWGAAEAPELVARSTHRIVTQEPSWLTPEAGQVEECVPFEMLQSAFPSLTAAGALLCPERSAE
ncbi:family 2 glycosyl transferase [Roseivivax marinus]|uniref:Family 2 glycosyl transferase n=1 Tax=Roseivivax marinus TaxID=1379903 RepID=W4HFV8_9RHOB|nr:glycosyltransferase [Roseivivax marinus]ETW11021.1 family 2 glycosyl transferase [Roseivivax marinus]